jgi:hypothetical protein
MCERPGGSPKITITNQRATRPGASGIVYKKDLESFKHHMKFLVRRFVISRRGLSPAMSELCTKPELRTSKLPLIE